mgnify:FL=1
MHQAVNHFLTFVRLNGFERMLVSMKMKWLPMYLCVDLQAPAPRADIVVNLSMHVGHLRASQTVISSPHEWREKLMSLSTT